MKLITESSWDVDIITEGENKEPVKIGGIFSTAETMVANGRIYPKKTLEREVEKLQEKIKNKRLLGELSHPPNPEIDLERAAILVEKLEWRNNDVWGSAKILNTPCGQIVKELVKEASVGVSSRSLGTVDEETKRVNEDLNVICWDVIGSPSNKSSWVNGIYEGKDFGNKPEDDEKNPEDIVKEALEMFKGHYGDAMKYCKEINEEAFEIIRKDFMKHIRKG